MHSRRSEADKAHPNTCGWILENESYKDWLSKQRGLLWIKGKPGAGKSTLLAFIYRMFQKALPDQENLSLEFFFHGRGAALQKTSIGMFRALLHQLYTRDSSIRESIRKAFQEKEVFGEVGKGWEWQLGELQDLFFNAILTAAKTRKVVIFIDALDEAGPETQELVDYFHELNDRLHAANNMAAICISCRHYPVIAATPNLEVRVEDNNYKDISSYVQFKLRANTREGKNESYSKSFNEIEHEIVSNASGVFQWARLVVQLALKNYDEGKSPSEIQEMLKKVPRELGAVYEHILNNIIEPENRKNTLHLMQWIFLAERPLTVDEIRFAMAFDEADNIPALQSYQDTKRSVKTYEQMKKSVNSLSGGLAEVILHEARVIVQFIHQSVNDFMNMRGLAFLVSKTDDNPNCQRTGQMMSLPHDQIIGRSQDRLCRCCVNYLRLAKVKVEWEDVKPEKGHNQLNRYLKFIDYAARFWFVHAEKAEKRGVLQEHLVKKFDAVDQLFEHWWEIYKLVTNKLRSSDTTRPELLHIASGSDLRSVVRLLLEKGVSIEAAGEYGNKALHHAAQRGHKEMIELLLQMKAKPGAKNGKGMSAMEIAAGNGYYEIVEILLSNGADTENALQAAAGGGSVILVKFLLEKNVDINTCGGKYGTALQAAALENHEPVVRMLLRRGAAVNFQGEPHGSALQAAAARGNETIVELLLKREADVNLQGGQYGTALQAAATRNRISVIRMLLNSGADVNAEGGPWGTALQAAAYAGNVDIVELLLDNGAKVNAQCGRYGNALQAACVEDRLDVCKLLLDRGANAGAQGGEYGDALQAAALTGNTYLIELLLKQEGVNVNAPCRGLYGNALQAACSKGRREAVELLLDEGANVNAQGGLHGNPLQAAARAYGGIMMIEQLIEKGAEVNAQGGEYKNALQAAAYNGYIYVVQELLKNDAYFDEDDEEFNRALREAVPKGLQEVTKRLVEKGFNKDLFNNPFDS